MWDGQWRRVAQSPVATATTLYSAPRWYLPAIRAGHLQSRLPTHHVVAKRAVISPCRRRTCPSAIRGRRWKRSQRCLLSCLLGSSCLLACLLGSPCLVGSAYLLSCLLGSFFFFFFFFFFFLPRRLALPVGLRRRLGLSPVVAGDGPRQSPSCRSRRGWPGARRPSSSCGSSRRTGPGRSISRRWCRGCGKGYCRDRAPSRPSGLRTHRSSSPATSHRAAHFLGWMPVGPGLLAADRFAAGQLKPSRPTEIGIRRHGLPATRSRARLPEVSITIEAAG